MLRNLNPIAKFIFSLVAAIGTTAITAIIFDPFSIPTVVVAVVNVLKVAAVYQFANGTYGWQKYVKGIVEVIGAVGTATVISIFSGQLDAKTFEMAITGLLGAAGVVIATNTDPYNEAAESEFTGYAATSGEDLA